MRIVLALDGSAASVLARDFVTSLPWPADTLMAVVGSYELPITWVNQGGVSGDWLQDAERELRNQLDDELTRLSAPLRDRGWQVDLRLVSMRAATGILSAADELDADLIVLGSRGHGPIRSMLLGSTSAEVADQARQSVLVVRSGAVSRLLVATDGSDCAAVIPDVLGDWQVFHGLPAVALSVAPVDTPAFELLTSLYTLGSDRLQQQREAVLADHRSHAEQMALRLDEIGLPAEGVTRSGDAAHEIVAVAAERGVDLIVTGSRCLHGIDRWVLGSVARNVLQHAHASVLIARRPQPVAPG